MGRRAPGGWGDSGWRRDDDRVGSRAGGMAVQLDAAMFGLRVGRRAGGWGRAQVWRRFFSGGWAGEVSLSAG